MLNFPKNKMPNSRKKRKKYDKKECKKRDKFQKRILKDLNKQFKIPVVKKLPLDVYPIGQKCSSYSNLPYGEIGTIGEAGCGVLAVEYALRLLDFDVRFEEIVEECVNKGYRGYIYDKNNNIIDGSGTHYSLFSNLAIELKSMKKIFKYAKKGYPITLLIQNSVYNNDKTNTGNHFITLIGFDENENAILMDGNKITDNSRISFALVIKPFKEIALGLRGAWAWNKEKVSKYL